MWWSKVITEKLTGPLKSIHIRSDDGGRLDSLPADTFFTPGPPEPLGIVELGAEPLMALNAADQKYGLALSQDEIDYLAHAYDRLGRDPTDVELMMFAQANSEHCRHKIFNASWTLDGRGSTEEFVSVD